jgi:hypothetical protein
MQTAGSTAVAGNRSFVVTRKGDGQPPTGRSFLKVVRDALPLTRSREVNLYRLRNLVNIWRGLWRIAIARMLTIPHVYGVVYAQKINRLTGEITNFGVVSFRVVTDTGVGYIVDAFQNTTELENMKFHGFGTGTNAEAAANTALQTELTTQYSTDNTRPTGSTTEGASANIYRTVGTLSPDASVAITEHGIFSQAATGGGVLLDRSVFSAINLTNVDSLQVTYDMTYTAGG